jgi:Trypsin-like peptidase domain
MSRSRSLALIVASALTAALAPAALASAAAPASADRADQARAEHERIVAYWTPERMKAAKPRDFVRQKDGSFTLAPTPKAKARPGGGTTTTTVTGASWSLNDTDVNERTGKVYFQFTEDDGWICSGAVVGDGGAQTASLVLTAGHCVFDQATQRFARNWLFIPDFDEKPTYTCADSEYGCWTADSLVAHVGFTREMRFNTEATLHDFAVAVVGLGGDDLKTDLDRAKNSAADQSAIGSYQVTTGDNFVSTKRTMSAFGYPAAGKYSGSILTFCTGPVSTDPNNGGRTWSLACSMTGGSSGGPWLTTGVDALSLTTGAGGKIGSLNSYGYSGLKYMFGPQFNEKTANVLEVATSIALGTPKSIEGVDHVSVP